MLLILIPIFSFGQSGKEIEGLIDSLNWRSITCDRSYHTFIINYQDSSVQKLIKIGKPAIERLFHSIEEPEKTVIIHMILTKITEPEKNNDYLPILYIYKDCNKIVGWHHFYNGLIWEWYSETNYSIEKTEIEKIRDYWKRRLYENIEPLNYDIEKIMLELNNHDEIKYPCIDNRIYQNNSAGMNINELLNLINKKFTKHNFNKVFKQLGNDSSSTSFDDCFFISFDTDGLGFRFNKDNLLTTIFFEPHYEGKIIYEINMTDKKEDIEKKAGTPDKKNNYGNEYWWYEKNGMGIDFISNTEIKSIQINKK